jgi:disulfide bond formation protein DsbB
LVHDERNSIAKASSSTDFISRRRGGSLQHPAADRKFGVHEKGKVASYAGLAYPLPAQILPNFSVMKKNPALALDLRNMSLPAAGYIIAAAGAATIAGAWFFQYVIGLVPCPLCLEQRVPYSVAIPLALVLGFFAHDPGRSKFARLLLIVIAAILAYGAALGVYHAGVEWGWWPGPVTCSSTHLPGGGGSILSQMQGTRVVPCDEAQWRFLGLSLAGYNALIAGALTLFALFIAMRGVKR